MRSHRLFSGAAALLLISGAMAAPAAMAADCKPTLLPPRVLRLVKPLMKARLHEAEEIARTGSWNPDSRASRNAEDRLAAVLQDGTPAGDQAVAYLLTVYLGEHQGEDVVCEVLKRGRRMVPLVRAVQECQPLTGLEPYPANVNGSGALVSIAMQGLESGEPCDD